MNVLYDQPYPHLQVYYYGHNHSEKSSKAVDQVKEIKECIRCLKKELKDGLSSKKTLQAELESDEKLLEQAQAALVQIEVARRTDTAMAQKITELVKSEVAASVTASMKAYTREVNQQISQQVQRAMQEFAPHLTNAVKAQVAESVEKALEIYATNRQVIDSSQQGELESDDSL